MPEYTPTSSRASSTSAASTSSKVKPAARFIAMPARCRHRTTPKPAARCGNEPHAGEPTPPTSPRDPADTAAVTYSARHRQDARGHLQLPAVALVEAPRCRARLDRLGGERRIKQAARPQRRLAVLTRILAEPDRACGHLHQGGECDRQQHDRGDHLQQGEAVLPPDLDAAGFHLDATVSSTRTSPVNQDTLTCHSRRPALRVMRPPVELPSGKKRMRPV